MATFLLYFCPVTNEKKDKNMPADLNQVEYYTEMLKWAEGQGHVGVVQHSDGRCGITHDGALTAQQLEAAYYGVLAKAGQLTSESELKLPAMEVPIDPSVVDNIRKAQTVVHPKPEVAAEASQPDAVQEAPAPGKLITPGMATGMPKRRLIIPGQQ